MSLLLPPQDSEIREMLDIPALARKEFTLFSDAKFSARRFFEKKPKGVRSLVYQVMRANDDIELISIGPRGGVKTLWKFGKTYEC